MVGIFEKIKRLLFPLATILFIFPCFSTYPKGNDVIQDMTISREVSKSLELLISSTNATSVETGAVISSIIVLKNPSFEEVKSFILKDPTSRKPFVLNQYECRHFAIDVVNDAVTEGLLCGFVLLCFDQGQHAVVAFNTIDRGLIYIEPQTDAAIEPQVGGEYQGKKIKEILIAW